jgi:hypothetical protein
MGLLLLSTAYEKNDVNLILIFSSLAITVKCIN